MLKLSNYGLFGTTFGFQATDIFLYRQAGVATLGYAVIGVLEMRSLRWQELRLPEVMALVFNGISCVARVVALHQAIFVFLRVLRGLFRIFLSIEC